MILGSDTFNRVGTTLGAGWTEHVGDGMATNMSTDGSVAIFDSAPAFHCATLAGTEAADHFVQCWLTVPNTSNNVGIVWRFIDRNNFYYLQITTGATGILLRKRHAGTHYTFVTTGTTGSPSRFVIRHIGNRIQVYHDQGYRTTGDGPLIDHTDTAGTPGGNPGPLTGSGPSGLISTGNVLGGIGLVQWNDFIARDGAADTIYVDLGFNGGVAGEGMGTLERPDLNIDWALNNCGTEAGSTIKILSTTTITNAVAAAGGAEGQFAIGHAGRFDRAFTFPTYDDANGRVTNPGSPNLIIEGANGATRTTLQETRGVRFFNVRETARGIVIRGFLFRLTGGVASATIQSGATADNSFTIDKCQVDYEVATGQGLQLTGGTHDRIQVRFCYHRSTVTGLVRFINGDPITNIDNLLIRMNVFDARVDVMSATTLAGAFVMDGAGIINVGDSWDFDHNTFLEIRANVATESALGLNVPANIDGAIEFQNNILFGRDGNNMSNGIYLPAGAITGTINAHHNGYFRVTTPRAAQVTNGGNEQDSSDPSFVNPAASFTWQHTAGQGLLGEGTFAAIAISGDFRPTAATYVDTADDSNALLGVLDRGALQGFEIPVSPSVPIEPGEQGFLFTGPCPPDYCLDVIFDPLNTTAYGGVIISDDLADMRPLRDSKDYLLREYRAQDVDLVFNDKRGELDPRNANSFLFERDYFKVRVQIRLLDNILGTINTIYMGELLTVSDDLGHTTWRLGNPFKRLLDKPLGANATGRIVDTGGNTPPTGNFINGLTLNEGARVEEWTFTFLNSDQFTAKGSLTGNDGTGSRSAPWTSDSGRITIQPSNWTTSVAWGAPNVTKIQTVWRSTGAISEVIKDLLISPEGGNLNSVTEIDNVAFDSLIGLPINVEITYIQDSEQTALHELSALSRHLSATTFPLPDGRISIITFIPRREDRSTLESFCHWDDLIDLTTEEIPIYNEFRFSFAYNQNTRVFDNGLSWPRTDEENSSFQRFGVRQPAPSTVEFRGFAAVQDTIVEQIAQQFYNRWSLPQELFTVKLKAQRYGLTLANFAFVQSLLPFREQFIELVELRKRMVPLPEIDVDGITTDRFLQSLTGCGFGFYVVEHFADDCWVYF